MTYFWAKTTTDGKPGISVYDHMANVGCVARCIADMSPRILERFQVQSSVVGALAALHDLGKISPGFQQKCKAWLEKNNLLTLARNGVWDTAMEKDHGKVSHAVIQAFLIEVGVDLKTSKYVSTVLGAHHGRLTPPNDRGYRPQKAISETYSSIDWDVERTTNAQMIWDSFSKDSTSFQLSGNSPSLWWLAGLTSVADWIGSDERFFSPSSTKEPINSTALAFQALDAIGFRKIDLVCDLSFNDLFHDLQKPESNWIPNEMQEKTVATVKGPGVYVIEAPMGTGKTEAALWAAYHLLVSGKSSGIYFALPTQATSNRIHLRMNDFLRRISPDTPASRLIHANSWLREPDCGIHPASTEKQESASADARAGRDWFASAKRALIAPFGVGTIDQALLGIVAAKHFFVRHFALAGKVVILDEVHSYDLYTGTLIDKLITTLEGLGCTVIVLSATLTGKRRGQIIAYPENTEKEIERSYPLITGRHEGHPVKPVAASPPDSRPVRVDFVSSADATAEAVIVARKGGAVLCIFNTVETAQKQHHQLIKMVQNEFPIGLLHSRFPFWRREQLEAEWMERFGKNGASRRGAILVSTQVVEQSVDLDADLLISELAPTDMLLQRLGRLWRHKRKWRPNDVARLCIIKEGNTLEELQTMEPDEIVKALGRKGRVYDPYVLMRSLSVWMGCEEINIPAQIRTLIESTYAEMEDEPESWSSLFNDAYGKTMAHRQKALMSSNVWNVPLPDEEGVQTRLNEIPTVSIILCRSVNRQKVVFIDNTSAEMSGDSFRLATAQAIHKNLVKVPEYCFENIEPYSGFVDYLYGKQCCGIVLENGVVEVKGLQSKTRLFYSDELGLVIKKSS